MILVIVVVFAIVLLVVFQKPVARCFYEQWAFVVYLWHGWRMRVIVRLCVNRWIPEDKPRRELAVQLATTQYVRYVGQKHGPSAAANLVLTALGASYVSSNRSKRRTLCEGVGGWYASKAGGNARWGLSCG